MNQSALIGGALIAGFVLWVARQDRLSSYARVFFGAKPEAHSSDAKGSSSGSSSNGYVVPDNIFDVVSDTKKMVEDFKNFQLPTIPGFGH